jgi:hypothetical protein
MSMESSQETKNLPAVVPVPLIAMSMQVTKWVDFTFIQMDSNQLPKSLKYPQELKK